MLGYLACVHPWRPPGAGVRPGRLRWRHPGVRRALQQLCDGVRKPEQQQTREHHQRPGTPASASANANSPRLLLSLVSSPPHLPQDADLLSPGIIINSVPPSSPTLEGSRHLSRSNIDIPRSSGPDDPKRQLPRKRSDSSTYELDTIKHHQAFLSRCRTPETSSFPVCRLRSGVRCFLFRQPSLQRAPRGAGVAALQQQHHAGGGVPGEV